MTTSLRRLTVFTLSSTLIAVATVLTSTPAFAAGPHGINGISLNDTNGALPPAARVQALGDAGAGWARIEFNTTFFGGTDTPAFYAAYDDLVDMHITAGMQVVGLVDYQTVDGSQADWQANNREHTGGDGLNNYLVELAETSARIAAHFEGRINLLEVWNEPNCFGQQPSPGVFIDCTYIYPSNFAALLTETYAQIKIYNNIDVQLISGGLFGHDIAGLNCSGAGSDYLADTYQQGIATGKFGWALDQLGTYPLDLVGQHFYISQGEQVAASDVALYLNCIRDTVAAWDTHPKDTVVSEFGWRTSLVSETIQGQNLRTAFRAMTDSGFVTVGLAFSYMDFGADNEWGIWSCEPERVECRKASYDYFKDAVTFEGRYSSGAVNQAILDAFGAGGGAIGLGSPVDNGGGPYVHFWDAPGADVQDFDGGNAGPAILVESANGAFVIIQGFRQAYLDGGAYQCGPPVNNEYAYGGGTRQDFTTCYMTWTPAAGVVIH